MFGSLEKKKKKILITCVPLVSLDPPRITVLCCKMWSYGETLVWNFTIELADSKCLLPEKRKLKLTEVKLKIENEYMQRANK